MENNSLEALRDNVIVACAVLAWLRERAEDLACERGENESIILALALAKISECALVASLNLDNAMQRVNSIERGEVI